VDKIVGLCFAGGSTVGVACRIDVVAEQLGIQAWNGTTPEFVDLTTKKLVTVTGFNNTKTITCSGQTLWQVGVINGVRIC